MKRKIIRAPESQGHKILEAQSGKLKEKLQALKQQIQQKKKEKEITKQGHLGQSNALHNSSLSKSQSSAHLDEVQTDLAKLLAGLHMDHLLPKLNQRNIHTLEEFKATQPETVDQWKDIPVGYRIKLKKQLNTTPATAVKPSLSPSPSKRVFASNQKQKHIEDIMEVRKKEKIFVALPGEDYEEEGDQQSKQQLSEFEQQEMIQSLMDAFKRTDDLQEIQLEPISKPTVILQAKEAWGKEEAFPNHRYCWTCLKKLTQESLQKYQDRQFCGPNCLQGYKQVLKVEQDDRLFAQIEQTENKFTKYLENRRQKGQQQRHPKIRDASREPEMEIDFQLA